MGGLRAQGLEDDQVSKRGVGRRLESHKLVFRCNDLRRGNTMDATEDVMGREGGQSGTRDGQMRPQLGTSATNDEGGQDVIKRESKANKIVNIFKTYLLRLIIFKWIDHAAFSHFIFSR